MNAIACICSTTTVVVCFRASRLDVMPEKPENKFHSTKILLYVPVNAHKALYIVSVICPCHRQVIPVARPSPELLINGCSIYSRQIHSASIAVLLPATVRGDNQLYSIRPRQPSTLPFFSGIACSVVAIRRASVHQTYNQGSGSKVEN